MSALPSMSLSPSLSRTLCLSLSLSPTLCLSHSLSFSLSLSLSLSLSPSLCLPLSLPLYISHISTSPTLPSTLQPPTSNTSPQHTRFSHHHNRSIIPASRSSEPSGNPSKEAERGLTITGSQGTGKGEHWRIPYAVGQPRSCSDAKKDKCPVYDVIVAVETKKLTTSDSRVHRLITDTVLEAVESMAEKKVDVKNAKQLKNNLYKGGKPPAVTVKSDSEMLKQPSSLSSSPSPSPSPALSSLSSSLSSSSSSSTVEKGEKKTPSRPVHSSTISVGSKPKEVTPEKSIQAKTPKPLIQELTPEELAATSAKEKERAKERERELRERGPETPIYHIVERGELELQQFHTERQELVGQRRPRYLVVKIELPKLENMRGVSLDITEKQVRLETDSNIYYLQTSLSFPVDDKKGTAKFSRKSHLLTIELPVKPMTEEEVKAELREREELLAKERENEEEEVEEEEEEENVKEEETKVEEQSQETPIKVEVTAPVSSSPSPSLSPSQASPASTPNEVEKEVEKEIKKETDTDAAPQTVEERDEFARKFLASLDKPKNEEKEKERETETEKDSNQTPSSLSDPSTDPSDPNTLSTPSLSPPVVDVSSAALPAYKWHEKEKSVVVVLQIKNIIRSSVVIDILEEKIVASFKTMDQNYFIEYDLFSLIDSQTSSYDVNNQNCVLHLKKKEKGLWGQLESKLSPAHARKMRSPKNGPSASPRRSPSGKGSGKGSSTSMPDFDLSTQKRRVSWNTKLAKYGPSKNSMKQKWKNMYDEDNKMCPTGVGNKEPVRGVLKKTNGDVPLNKEELARLETEERQHEEEEEEEEAERKSNGEAETTESTVKVENDDDTEENVKNETAVAKPVIGNSHSHLPSLFESQLRVRRSDSFVPSSSSIPSSSGMVFMNGLVNEMA